ncbi:class I SAM-dependent methyltransferase [Candidatus Omnitrophota bacterium]
MGQLLNIVTPLHKKTERDYIGRMQDDKIECMKIAKKYGQEYWDGDRRYGYGGYKYDGRWKVVVQRLIETFGLTEDAKILDVGCGKAHLLYEFMQLLPQCTIKGFDISEYAIQNAKEEVKDALSVQKAQDSYPLKDSEFDLVISITTLHNLAVNDLKLALQEIERVGKNKYIVVESFRNESELFNLECWALTCEAFFSNSEWEWLFKEYGYTGDYEFIYFE